MSPRDVLNLFLQVPNPQIRTAVVGPPPVEEHPLDAAEASRERAADVLKKRSDESAKAAVEQQ